MIGFRSPVQGVLPILFPSHVPRIGIFCLIHKCCPVLLPAGSIRGSSPVRLVRSLLQTKGASGSRHTSSTIWIRFRVFRTVPKHMLMQPRKNCMSQGHSWKLAYPLRTFEGATAMSILGWWRLAGTPLPAETRNCGAQNQAEISRLKIKFGDLPRWVAKTHAEQKLGSGFLRA